MGGQKKVGWRKQLELKEGDEVSVGEIPKLKKFRWGRLR